MLLFVLRPERSTARNTCPTRPSGLIASWTSTSPPRLTGVLWSNVGVTAEFFAFDERMHHNCPVEKVTPPMNRFPLLSTSSVPQEGPFGILIGSLQLNPLFMERE